MSFALIHNLFYLKTQPNKMMKKLKQNSNDPFLFPLLVLRIIQMMRVYFDLIIYFNNSLIKCIFRLANIVHLKMTLNITQN